jgi:peptidoglycan/LPS O-acetylase OafA/YrhL
MSVTAYQARPYRPATVANEAAAGVHVLRHIPELDGIRGLAALVVFGHHALTTTVRETLEGGWPASIQSLSHMFEYANTGVDLFFVLSGFLITSVLIGEQGSTRYYQDFYWKRALRILPLYLLMLPFVWMAFHQTAHTVMALFFVVNFYGLLHLPGLIEPGPFWSLAIEEQFYLLWPTVVRRMRVGAILRWSIGLGLASMAARAVLALGRHHDYALTPLRCDGLAFGAALACHFHIAGNNIRMRRRITPLLLTLLAVGAVLIALSRMALLGLMYSPGYQTGIVLVTGALVGLTIAYTGTPALAMFRSRILVFFGLISYAFYMVHLYVIHMYKHFAGQRLPAGDVAAFWTQILVCFTGSTALAVVIRYTLELPAFRLRKYVLKHPNRAAEHAHPPLPLARM